MAQSIPPEMRDAMITEFKFTEADLAKVESGKAIARMVPTGKPDDVRMAGAIRIEVSPDEFMRAFRDIEHFQFSKEALHTGRFKDPPSEMDMAGFRLPDLNKAELLACHPGACSYKMPAAVMEELQTKIDWNAPDSRAKAEALIHKLWINGLLDYQKRGDAALVVYFDTPAPYSVAEGLHSLIGSETRLSKKFPELLLYAEQYPNSKPLTTDDLFYWQEAAFGLKHVIRLQHVIVQQLADSHYAIISKMLFASHYFRAAIEFNYIYPVITPEGKPAIYFAAAQRSYVDGMTGFKGSMLRKIAEGRSPATMIKNLELAKQFLERKQ